MSTNRAKIDWAYKKAEQIMTIAIETGDYYDAAREIAKELRKAERKGKRKAF